jgi:hypothetical protein
MDINQNLLKIMIISKFLCPFCCPLQMSNWYYICIHTCIVNLTVFDFNYIILFSVFDYYNIYLQIIENASLSLHVHFFCVSRSPSDGPFN